MWERLVLPLLKNAIEAATPDIRNQLVDFLKGLENMAKATPNPVDDLLVMLVRGILDL